MVHRVLLTTEWTMTVTLGGALTPTASPIPKEKMTFIHVKSGKAGNGLN